MWLFDGSPDDLGLSVQDASPMEGGYVVVLELMNCEIRMLATRFPSKYISTWKSRTRRYGGEELKRVMVSQPHPRYERVKRLLIERLAVDQEVIKPEDGAMDSIKRRAESIFSIKTSISNSEQVPTTDPATTSRGHDARRTVWVTKY